MRTSHKKRRGFTLIETLILLGCLIIVVAITTPAIVQARSSARKSTCKNNLKQIGLALHNYHDTHNMFPPGWITTHLQPAPSYGYGWMTMILPYVEQVPLYRQLNPSKKPLSSENELLQSPITTYRCPSDNMGEINSMRSFYGTSNYSGNAGTGMRIGFREPPKPAHWIAPRRMHNWPGVTPLIQRSNGVFWSSFSATRIRDITDGTSNTFMVGERSSTGGAGIWAGVARNDFVNDAVTDCSPGNELNSGFSSFSSHHENGAHFVFCDGRVRFIDNNIDPIVYQRASMRDDGQVLEIH